MKILIVDDDAPTRHLMEAVLEKMGHSSVFAKDGLDAWQILNATDINVVVCDWYMPRMNGIELCHHIRKSKSDSYIYFVLFTGRQSTSDLDVAMEAGADDFLHKPVTAKDMGACLKVARRILSLEAKLKARNRDLETANKQLSHYQARLKSELSAAAYIQKSLLPATEPVNLPVEIAWDTVPTEELAGDFLGYYPLDDRHLGFYVADVSGHGIPAAMLSVHIAKSLSPEIRKDSIVRRVDEVSSLKNSGAAQYQIRNPKEVAETLNAHFPESEGDMYLTLIYGFIDTTTGKGVLCQAGHPYPYILRKDGCIERLGQGGFPIGLLENADYDQIRFQLAPGDSLILYTDGITECFNPKRQAFGEHRLIESLSSAPGQHAKQLLDSVKTHVTDWRAQGNQNANLEDDASLLVLKLTD